MLWTYHHCVGEERDRMTDTADLEATVNGHHGDIMQQLLDHQRKLREVVPATAATRRFTPSHGLIDYSLLERLDSSTSGLLDLTGAESGGAADSADRLAEVQARLTSIQRDLNDARRRAYDAVLALDDRLSEIERGVMDVASHLLELE
jgi:hypothetical protein